jgi:cell division protein YceG involved in septum cleavage
MASQLNDIHDLKEPLTISFNFLPFIIFFSILIILIIILTYFSMKRGKSLEIINPQENLNYKLSPKNIALAELENIRKEKLIENEKIDFFYNRITSLLKTFLFQEYEIKCESKTSNEILAFSKEKKLKEELLLNLDNCLKNLDLKKYSKTKIDSKEMEKSFDLISTFIKNI